MVFVLCYITDIYNHPIILYILKIYNLQNQTYRDYITQSMHTQIKTVSCRLFTKPKINGNRVFFVAFSNGLSGFLDTTHWVDQILIFILFQFLPHTQLFTQNWYKKRFTKNSFCKICVKCVLEALPWTMKLKTAFWEICNLNLCVVELNPIVRHIFHTRHIYKTFSLLQHKLFDPYYKYSIYLT